jgi:hypothetical protein
MRARRASRPGFSVTSTVAASPARGDIESIIGSYTEDCEFHAIGPATIPYYGIHRGKDAIRNNYFAALMSTQGNQNLAVERFVAQRDT